MKQLYLGAEEGEGMGLTRQSKGCCSLKGKTKHGRENGHGVEGAECGGAWGQLG